VTNEERAKAIRLVVFDVDGVLTDGGLWYGPDGEVMKRFDVKDGHAIVLARLAGLPVAILTARSSKIVETRAKELGVAFVFQGRKEKGPALVELCAQAGVSPERVAFMGDDVNDLPALRQCGLSACPADAVQEVREAVHFVSSRAGGHGAARELIDFVLTQRARSS